MLSDILVQALGEGTFSSTSLAQGPTTVATNISTTVPTGMPTATTVVLSTLAPVVTAIPFSTRTSAPAASSATTAPPATVVAAQVIGVEPQRAGTDALPFVLTIRGANLGLVRAARLVSDGRSPIDTAIQSSGADQLTLSAAALPELLNGEANYRLELDGTVLEAPAIVLRDFLDRKTVQGVLPEYDYTSRVASDAAGAYTRMRAEPDVVSQSGGTLRNSDEVEILADNGFGWYLVRIHTSSDPGRIGTTGWVERWFVDNQDVPPSPTPRPKPQPLAFVGRIYSTPTGKAVKCGTSFASSIYGTVENSSGKGIRGAVLRVVSTDCKNSFTTTTARDGTYTVGGLGCTTWTIRLVSIPGIAIQANVVTVKNLNGGHFTSAEVRFKLQQ